MYSKGTTGAQFLELSVGARATAMGESFVAVANDATALFWNPAGLAILKSKEFSASHHSYIQEINYETVAYAQPTKFGAFGTGIHYLYFDNAERRNVQGNMEGSFGASDYAFTLSFARALVPERKITGGVNFKLIRQQIDSFYANAMAVDFGLLSPLFGSGLTLGLSLQNLGTELQFLNESFSLPLTSKMGLSWAPQRLPMTIASSISIPKGDDPNYQFGSEIWLHSSFALRTGYRFGSSINKLMLSSQSNDESSISKTSGIMAGAGIRFSNFQLDYSFTPLGDLGNGHRATLSMKFR